MIEKQLRFYLLAQGTVSAVLGTKHIYAGRIPQKVADDSTYTVALVLTRSNSNRYYNLPGEATIVQSDIDFEFIASTGTPPATIDAAFEAVRLVLSGYRGEMGDVGNEVYIHGVTIERDLMPEPVKLTDGSDRWTYTYSADFKITHNQAATTA